MSLERARKIISEMDWIPTVYHDTLIEFAARLTIDADAYILRKLDEIEELNILRMRLEDQSEIMFHALEDIASEQVKNLGSARIIARRAMSKVVHKYIGIDIDV